MLRFSKYWLFQSFGWLSFAFINIYIAALLNELTKDLLIVNILISVLGFILSHQFRNYILKNKLASLGTEKLLIVLTAAISILSIIYNLVYYLCLYFLYDNTVLKLSATTVFGSFVSVFFLFTVWSIIYFAWTYVETNRRNLIDRLKMESALKDLELKTIRSNLQPHFIFNSLNSIRALIDENPELARNAITHISNILRSSITQQEITDTLENELTLVDDYLALEKIRFEERLSFSKEIESSCLAYQVPTMMLQTIVENAIKHGISKLEQGGRIYIKAYQYEENLNLEIMNTGHLNLNEKNVNSLGFGLNSTKQRLKLIYQNDASFKIFEKDDKVYVQVKIKIK